MFHNLLTQEIRPLTPVLFSTSAYKLPRLSSKIIDINNIQDILPYICDQTVVVCDLDLTLMRLVQSLGCDRWFDGYIVEQNKIHNDINKAVAITVNHYTKIQKSSKVKPVEECTVNVMQELHLKASTVLALTARDSELKDATMEQLASIGISFNQGKHAGISVPLSQSATSHAHNGVIFCAGKNKGECLEEYLIEHLDYKPERILFIDDKIKHIQAVQNMCDRLGIEFIGIHYTRTHFDPEVDVSITKKQLDVFLESGDLISDEEALRRVGLDANTVKLKPGFT